ncbi:MAG TPA: hypothetical protein VJA28_00640 [Patescibacteria group bacterium]|nr:hypothetical protein [Patescibacteria group bacterium]
MFYNPAEPIPPMVLLFAMYLLFGASFALGMMSATSIFLLGHL